MAPRAANAGAPTPGNGALVHDESYTGSGTVREHQPPACPVNTGRSRVIHPVSPTKNPRLQDHADACKPQGLQAGLGAGSCNDLHRETVPAGGFGSSSGATAPEKVAA